MSLKFPLATASWGVEEKEAMHRVIESGMYTLGVNVRTFEQDFSKYVSSRRWLVVNAG